MKEKLVLKGKNFVMRPMRRNDFEEFLQCANNKKVCKNMIDSFSYPYTVEKAKKWINKTIQHNKTHDITSLVIEVDGKFAGSVGGSIKDEPHILTFGYWLGEKYWGRGIMTQAVKLYCSYIIKNFPKIKRIQAFVYPWNNKSKNVLLKNGFKEEGLLKKSAVKDGLIIDEYIFSKIR